MYYSNTIINFSIMYLLFDDLYVQFLLFKFHFLGIFIIYDLQHIRKIKSNDAWLIYFDIIDKRNLRDTTLTLKKFLIQTRAFNISKDFYNSH